MQQQTNNSILNMGGPYNYDYSFKIVMTGDSNVGKSNILSRFVTGNLINGNQATIGIDFMIKIIRHKNYNIRLELWDTAGQERYMPIHTHYYNLANGIVLVFDLNDNRSFENLDMWLAAVEKSCKTLDKYSFLLVGNKSDSGHNITNDEIKAFMNKHSDKFKFTYCETSAKDNIGIETIFNTLIDEMIAKYKEKFNKQKPLEIHDKKKNVTTKCCVIL